MTENVNEKKKKLSAGWNNKYYIANNFDFSINPLIFVTE